MMRSCIELPIVHVQIFKSLSLTTSSLQTYFMEYFKNLYLVTIMNDTFFPLTFGIYVLNKLRENGKH